ncbi:MAG TPA: hypothetical protein ENI95_13320, partial [Chloroflexi bacterium]|nr:hypothetical protein [Chloroflexota bacterium]
MRILRRLTGVLSAGYILFYYSEILFWARVRPTDSLPDWIAGWLLYSLMAFIVLSLIARFRVRTLWALFLVGAAFGWLVEGLIVQTLYEELPFSISFTGLAWHALITVWVGWYAVRRALHTGFLPTVLLAAAIGIVYGFWAITWWVEPEGGVSSPLQFAVYTTLSSLLLILACWLHDRTVPISFTPSRVADGVLIALALLYFAFITVPVAPLAAGILPFLLLVIYLP